MTCYNYETCSKGLKIKSVWYYDIFMCCCLSELVGYCRLDGLLPVVNHVISEGTFCGGRPNFPQLQFSQTSELIFRQISLNLQCYFS